MTRPTFDNVAIGAGLIDPNSVARFQFDGALDALEQSARAISHQAHEIVDACVLARNPGTPLSELNPALGRLLNLHNDAGFSGPIGSKWEKVLVASSQAQHYFWMSQSKDDG